MVQSSIALRIGTRGSPLALAQAHEVRRRLTAAYGFAEPAVEICVIRTSGDVIQDRPLSEAGGKGLFTKEIEQALLDGAIDVAVHSSKDLPTLLPEGLMLAAFLPREDVRDAFISPKARHFTELPPGAVIGTASLRRQAQVKRLRPDLSVKMFRGNVETRLRKIGDGEADATLLAVAGLNRLGLAEKAASILSVNEFLPAVGQGAIGLEARIGDSRIRDLLEPINHAETATALDAERAFLAILDGSCRTPIAGHATVSEEGVAFRGLILRPDGSESFETTRSGSRAEAAALGADAGAELRSRAPADFFGTF